MSAAEQDIKLPKNYTALVCQECETPSKIITVAKVYFDFVNQEWKIQEFGPKTGHCMNCEETVGWDMRAITYGEYRKMCIEQLDEKPKDLSHGHS